MVSAIFVTWQVRSCRGQKSVFAWLENTRNSSPYIDDIYVQSGSDRTCQKVTNKAETMIPNLLTDPDTKLTIL